MHIFRRIFTSAASHKLQHPRFRWTEMDGNLLTKRPRRTKHSPPMDRTEPNTHSPMDVKTRPLAARRMSVVFCHPHHHRAARAASAMLLPRPVALWPHLSATNQMGSRRVAAVVAAGPRWGRGGDGGQWSLPLMRLLCRAAPVRGWARRHQ